MGKLNNAMVYVNSFTDDNKKENISVWALFCLMALLGCVEKQGELDKDMVLQVGKHLKTLGRIRGGNAQEDALRYIKIDYGKYVKTISDAWGIRCPWKE